MKTLFFVTPQYGRKNGGLGVSAERILKALKSEYKIVLFEGSSHLAPLTFERHIKNELFTHIQFSKNGEDKTKAQFLSDLLLFQNKTTSCDALLSFYIGELSFPSLFSAQMLKKPCCVFGRGNDIDLEIFGSDSDKIFRVLEKSKRVFCVSKDMEQKVLALCPHAKTLFVANSVDTETFKPTPNLKHREKEKPTVGIFGDIKLKKGFEFLLTHLDFSKFNLKIVGTLREESAKFLHGHLSIQASLSHQIEQAPFTVSTEDLIKQYESVDIVCVPSSHEGMPNVLLEAMSLQKICVASCVGGAPDIIQDGEDAFLFEAWNEKSFYEALEKAHVALSTQQSHLIGEKARIKMINNFHPKIEEKNYRRALNAVLNTGA